uniref:Uncharacterized protein n=1 Tax=Arundo donax TaxID=35708 RepID=A0A0A9CMD6_ARUDO
MWMMNVFAKHSTDKKWQKNLLAPPFYNRCLPLICLIKTKFQLTAICCIKF